MFPYCCLLIIASIITMFSFQGASELPKKLNEVSLTRYFSQFLKKWWRLAGSNRWPPACKAGALPAELNPQIFLKWWAKDSLFCGKATAVTTCHRHVVKSRLSSPFWLANQLVLVCPGLNFYFALFWSGGPKWTRTIDLTIISRVL